MNSRQKIVLIVYCFAIALMMAFPPFHLNIRSVEIGKGYAFILTPPMHGALMATVDSVILITEMAGVSLIATVVWFLLKGK